MSDQSYMNKSGWSCPVGDKEGMLSLAQCQCSILQCLARVRSHTQKENT